jgi:hypothetical protein
VYGDGVLCDAQDAGGLVLAEVHQDAQRDDLPLPIREFKEQPNQTRVDGGLVDDKLSARGVSVDSRWWSTGTSK